MCCQPGNAETCSLFEGDAVGQGCRLLQRNNSELGGSAKRTIRLRTITPDVPPDPFLRYACTHPVDGARTITVRDDPGIRHSNAEGIFALLHITWIHSRSCHANAYLAGARLWIVHFPYYQNVARRTLLFIPCCFHRG